MLRKLNEFTFSRAKVGGNKPGAFYKDNNNEEWLIKYYSNNLRAVTEAFAGALFSLFAGKKHIPEVSLVEGVNPIDKETKFMVASQVRGGYKSFEDTQLEFDPVKKLYLLNGKPIEGLELMIILSLLLRERDFYGNGNVGFDVEMSHEELNDIAAFRIDFDDTFLLDKIKNIEHFNSIGEMLSILDAKAMLVSKLFHREKAWDAIKQISQVDSNRIDELFQQFKPFFEEAVKRDKEKIEIQMQNCKDQYRLNDYKDRINDIESELRKIESLLAQIKLDQIYLEGKFKSFYNPSSSFSSGIYSSKQTTESADVLKQFQDFFTIYDNLYTSLYEDLPKRWAKKLVDELSQKGESSSAYIEYKTMRKNILDIVTNDEFSLTYQLKYLEYLNNHAESFNDYEIRHEIVEKKIANLKDRVMQHAEYKKVIDKTDKIIESIISPSQNDFVNDGKFALIKNVKLAGTTTFFTLETNFPGQAVDEKKERINNQDIWNERVKVYDKIFRSTRVEISRQRKPEGYEVITYKIKDPSKANEILAKLKEESDKFEPFSSDNFFDKIMQQLNKIEFALRK